MGKKIKTLLNVKAVILIRVRINFKEDQFAAVTSLVINKCD